MRYTRGFLKRQAEREAAKLKAILDRSMESMKRMDRECDQAFARDKDKRDKERT